MKQVLKLSFSRRILLADDLEFYTYRTSHWITSSEVYDFMASMDVRTPFQFSSTADEYCAWVSSPNARHMKILPYHSTMNDTKFTLECDRSICLISLESRNGYVLTRPVDSEQ